MAGHCATVRTYERAVKTAWRPGEQAVRFCGGGDTTGMEVTARVIHELGSGDGSSSSRFRLVVTPGGHTGSSSPASRVSWAGVLPGHVDRVRGDSPGERIVEIHDMGGSRPEDRPQPLHELRVGRVVRPQREYPVGVEMPGE